MSVQDSQSIANAVRDLREPSMERALSSRAAPQDWMCTTHLLRPPLSLALLLRQHAPLLPYHLNQPRKKPPLLSTQLCQQPAPPR